MSWEDFDRAAIESGGRFLTLKDGTKIVGVFRGDPYTYYAKFKDKNEYRTWVEGRSFKFRLNLIIEENGKWVAKILQGGAMMASQIRAVKEKYGLGDHVFEISRKGSDKDSTEYFVMYERKLDDTEKAQINAVKLNSLTRDKSKDSDEPTREPGEDFPPHNDDDERFPA